MRSSRLVDDRDQPRRGVVHARLFLQQLRRVADRAQRIAHFVRDVGGEAPDRSQLELAGLRLDAALVLEKDDRADAPAAADRHEARADVVAKRRARPGIHAHARAPFVELGGEHGGVLGQRFLAAAPRQLPEQPLGPRIELANGAALVHHEHPVLHVADDELVHLLHVGEIDLALRGELLTRDGVARQRVSQPGDREVRRGEQARLHELRLRDVQLEHLVCLLEQHPDAGQRREEQGEAAAADEPRAGERGEQEQAQAAGNAAAGVQQEHDEADIGRDLEGQLQVKAPARADQNEPGDPEDQVDDAGDHEQREVARAEPEGRSPDRHAHEQQQRDEQAVDVEVEQRAPEWLGVLAGGRAGVSLPQRGTPHADRAHFALRPASCARS
jgi:hypothetical protein